MEALGTDDPDFAQALVHQLASAGSVDPVTINFLLSVVKNILPRDHLEAMLAAQMAAIHLATMASASRLAQAQNMPQLETAERACNRLARTFTTQLEALKHYRTGGEQRVTVHHVVALANLPHREGELFRRPDGRAYERPKRPDDTSAGSRIKKAFAGACSRAGIKDFSVHGCRHTWATWHYAENRDVSALMRLGGWKTVSMVMRYVHANVDEHRHTIDRLPGGNLGEQAMREQNHHDRRTI
jgi:hypothetical protein